MEQMRYTLGLDIGITSVGWAVLENNAAGEPIRIVRFGSRIFEKAEQPKGESLAAPRRDARGARRVIRRRRHRKERIRSLIVSEGMVTTEFFQALEGNSRFEKSVYELRIDALDRLLTNEEAARLLLHMAQRRGYQSNSRAAEEADKESGKVKRAISENQHCMAENGYRTVGEMLWKDARFQREMGDDSIHVVHNAPDDYKVTVERGMLWDELRLIFEAQRSFGAAWATDEFCEHYLAIWGGQRSFDEGPGAPSPYGGSQILGKVADCTFEQGEKRAAKASYTFEYFRLLQDINHIRLVRSGEPAVPLTPEQREICKRLTIAKQSATYASLRKELDLPNTVTFNNLYYGECKAQETLEQLIARQEKKKLNEMQSYYKIRKALDKVEKNAIQQLSADQMDQIGWILTCYKTDSARLEKLAQANIPAQYHQALLSLSFSGFGHLSLKAMKKLIPHLEQGVTYDKAVRAVYEKDVHEEKRKRKLSLMDAGEIRNPVVRRAVSQTVKVINAIVRTYGAPEAVRIELARELGKSFKERDKITKRQDANKTKNDQIREQIPEYKGSQTVTGQDIVKFKLFQEQNGVCLYSGNNLDISRLFEPGYVDVDHIIPYSVSFDDGYNNKVLVLSSENRQKGNRLPYGYFGQDAARWDAFETRVNTQIHSYKKRRNLLLRALPTNEEFKQRNLVDTQYLSRMVFRLVDEHLEFAETADKKRKTQTVNGAVTGEIRKRLGIRKIRADGDLHHAVDAVIIGCTSPGMIQKITRAAQHRERYYPRERFKPTEGGYTDKTTGEFLTEQDYAERYSDAFPEPWPQFRSELAAWMSHDPAGALAQLKLATYSEVDRDTVKPPFVSRMPRHKTKGALHEATVRSGRKPGYTISRAPLIELKLNKDGEIEKYYNPSSDPLLYHALKARLQAYGGNAEKAFAEPFYKPKADGTNGSLVRRVKICEKLTQGVLVNKGIAKNGSMLRVDVFRIENDGYYFVPIYVSDTGKTQLPNRAVVASKPLEEWKPMREEDFLFSITLGDLLYIRGRKPISLRVQDGGSGEPEIFREEGLFYFGGLNTSSGAITITTHDRQYKKESLGGKTLLCLEKYQVDVLGNYAPVSLPEKRQEFR